MISNKEDIFKKRRAVRELNSKKIENKILKEIFLAASYAPSGLNQHPIYFIVVKDKKIKEKLSKVQPGGTDFVAKAGAVIVVCANPKQSGVWREDASVATGYMWLKCAQLGLGACWAHVIRGRKGFHNRNAEAHVRKLLRIPPCIRVLCFLAIGYPVKSRSPHEEEEYLADKIYSENWGKRFK